MLERECDNEHYIRLLSPPSPPRQAGITQRGLVAQSLPATAPGCGHTAGPEPGSPGRNERDILREMAVLTSTRASEGAQDKGRRKGQALFVRVHVWIAVCYRKVASHLIKK